MLSSGQAATPLQDTSDTSPGTGIIDTAKTLFARLAPNFRPQTGEGDIQIGTEESAEMPPAKTEQELRNEARQELDNTISAHNAPINAKMSMYLELFKQWLNLPKKDMLAQGIVERKIDVILLFLQSNEAQELHDMHIMTSDGKLSKTTALEDLFNSEIPFVESAIDVKESKIITDPTRIKMVGEKLFPLLCKMVNGQKPPITHETSKTFNQDDVRALILEMMKIEKLNTNIAKFESYKNKNFAPFHYIAASGDMDLIKHFLNDPRIEIDYLDRPQWTATRDAIRTFLSPALGKEIEGLIHEEATRRLKILGQEHKISSDGFEDLLRAQAATRNGSTPADPSI